jgi:catechol 2,3-dioxygenase-like lactoylglutathione lyase family enzyme
MLDHISLGVANLARSTTFYDAVLSTLGYVRLWTNDGGAGYGRPGWKDEKLALFEKGADAQAPGAGWQSVDRFHSVALMLGAVDVGEPGLRPQYGEGYYAAFVQDWDGYKLEAVCHET